MDNPDKTAVNPDKVQPDPAVADKEKTKKPRGSRFAESSSVFDDKRELQKKNSKSLGSILKKCTIV